jgi:hypothetical protein
MSSKRVELLTLRAFKIPMGHSFRSGFFHPSAAFSFVLLEIGNLARPERTTQT